MCRPDSSFWFSRRKPSSSRLWSLIVTADWEGALKLLADSSVELPVGKRSHSDAFAKLPILSFALWHDAPLDVVKALIRREPKCLYEFDSIGRRPLHIACMRQKSPDLADLLVSIDLRLALQLDSLGNLPLHYAVVAACGSGDIGGKVDDHLDIMTSLIAAELFTTVVPNDEVLTPIDLARRLEVNCDKRVYQMLLKTAVVFDSFRLYKNRDMSASIRSTSDVENTTEGAFDSDELQATGERPRRRNACILLACS